MNLIFIKIIVIYNSINKIIKFTKNIYIETIHKYKNTTNFVKSFKKIFTILTIITTVSLIFLNFNTASQIIVDTTLITIYKAHYIAIPKYPYIVYNNTIISFSNKFLFYLLIVIINIEFEFTNIIIKTI